MADLDDADPKVTTARGPAGAAVVPGSAWLHTLHPRWRLGLAALLAVNLLPLAGVLGLGWDLGLVLLLYWVESAVILFFSLVKVGMVSGIGAIFLIPFFLFHAGMFMLVHLVFIATLLLDRPDGGWGPWLLELAIGAGALFASHLVSFITNVVRGGERPASGQAVMVGFYARIAVMQLTLILGGFLTTALGSPAWALALLVALKTVADVAAHLRERRQASQAGQAPT